MEASRRFNNYRGKVMLELIQKIKTYTEAGIILEHMELFNEVEVKPYIDLDKPVLMKCPDCGREKVFLNVRTHCYCGRCSILKQTDIILVAVENREA